MSVVYQGKWIFIEERPTCGKKTKEFEVWSIYEPTALGLIKWKASWRKYAFYSYENSHFEETCLYDIADFIKAETKKYKEGWMKK